MAKQKAIRFRQMHLDDGCFIMANAWDAGSAVLLEQAGFGALGTTSAGIAYSHGLPDGAAALSFERALEATAEIVDAIDVPLSMDSENLYAHEPDAVYDNMKRIAATGVAGASIEDYRGDPENPYYDIELAVERVRAARAALAGLDYPFTLTARAALGLVRRAAREMLDHGSFGYADGQIADGELCQLFAARVSREK